MTDFKVDINTKIFQNATRKLRLRFPVAEISTKTGYAKGGISDFLNNKKPVSDEFLKKFADAYNIKLDDYKDFEEQKVVEPKSVISVNSSVGIPYYDIDFMGGWNSEELFSTQKPSFFITSPTFERAEFACNLFGNSISKRIPSTAIIGLKEVTDWQTYFPTNEIYAILLKNDTRTVKIVKREKGTNNLILIPDPLDEHNKIQFEEEIVPIDFIRSFFQVVAWGQFQRLSI
jgi:transcriptional regulator with XRE-family HTH domain